MILTRDPPASGLALAALLSRFLASSRAGGLTPPPGVAVHLVFPRRDTYSPAEPFPVVFALQGASAAWALGFALEWRIRRAHGCRGECAIVDTGRLSAGQGGPDGVVFFAAGDYYVYKDVSTALGGDWALGVAGGGSRGAYSLEWEFALLAGCSAGAGALQSRGGVSRFSGSSTFSVEAGASPDVEEQLEGCPIPGGVVAVEGNLDGCPSLGAAGAEPEPDPCVVKVPEDVISNVVAQMAAGGSPEQPGAPAIPGVPLPGGPPTTVIGYPGGDGEAETKPAHGPDHTSDHTSGLAPEPTSGRGDNHTAARTSAHGSAHAPPAPTGPAGNQTSSEPTTVVVSESANDQGRLFQAALVAVLSALGVYLV